MRDMVNKPLRRKACILIPYKANPKAKEKTLASILVQKFNVDVEFIPEGITKTPDIEFMGKMWEIKSPRGKDRRTIENCLRAAAKQSCHVILDLRFMFGIMEV